MMGTVPAETVPVRVACRGGDMRPVNRVQFRVGDKSSCLQGTISHHVSGNVYSHRDKKVPRAEKWRKTNYKYIVKYIYISVHILSLLSK